jgi:hypothetical protein
VQKKKRGKKITFAHWAEQNFGGTVASEPRPVSSEGGTTRSSARWHCRTEAPLGGAEGEEHMSAGTAVPAPGGGRFLQTSVRSRPRLLIDGKMDGQKVLKLFCFKEKSKVLYNEKLTDFFIYI